MLRYPEFSRELNLFSPLWWPSIGAFIAFSKVAENFSTICQQWISLLVSSWPGKAYYISERQLYNWVVK